MAKNHLDEIMWGFKFRRQKSKEVSRNEFLRTIPFFEHLSEKQLKTLAQQLHERRYEENEFLFEINHPGAGLFILRQGEVAIETSSDPQSSTQLATIKSGEFLGELALLDESPRSASARAIKPTVAYVLSRADLNRLRRIEPEIVCEVYRNLAWLVGERLKATNRQATKMTRVG